MKYPENHLQDMTLVIRQISSLTLITGEFLMFRKLTVIAVAALACSGAMAATETFNFNTAGQTPVSFSADLTGGMVGTGWNITGATWFTNVLLDGGSAGVTAGASYNGYVLGYRFSAQNALAAHTVSYTVNQFGNAPAPTLTGSFTSVASNSPAPVLNSTNVAAVPEPETYAMMLAGLGALGFVGRRRKAK